MIDRSIDALARVLRCGLVAGMVALAACDGVPPPLPESPEVVNVNNVHALRSVAGSGTFSHLESQTRTSGTRHRWIAMSGDTPRKILSHEELQGKDDVLAVEDRDAILWSAPPSGHPEMAMMCATIDPRHGESRCEHVDFRVRADPVALAANDRGEAVLLINAGAAWHGLWMRAGAGGTPWQRFELPLVPTQPQLLHGAAGAQVAWRDAAGMHLLQLDRESGVWRTVLELADATGDFWVTGQQRGQAGRGWLLTCTTAGMQAHRIDAAGVAPMPAPTVAGCAGITEPPRLAVSDNGDALLLWVGEGTIMSTRWSEADAAWSPPAALAGVDWPTRLVADESGRFAFLSQRVKGPLLLHVLRPVEGLQAPIELIGAASHLTPSDLAAGESHVAVAWSRPASQGEGSRLATASFDLRQTYAAVQVRVQGNGSVVSTPAGIACPQACRADLAVGSTVQLQARPGDGQRFAGWSGGCSGAAAQISLEVAEATICTAQFEAAAQAQLTLAVQGGGRASATPAGPSYVVGTSVTLQAMPDAGQRFVGWTGDADCADGRLTMDANRACTASFEADPDLVPLTLQVRGGGRVLSTPAGLDCVGDCVAYFRRDSSVVLTAQPPAGTRLVWGGGCGATQGESATLVLAAAATCGVVFEPLAAQGWQAVGGGRVPGSGNLVGRPAIAADAQGLATIAYSVQRAELRELYVLRQSGGGWQQVGPGMLNDPLVSANAPSLALDAQGQPVVAFGDARGRVQVRHWDGARWLHLADDLSVAAGAVTSAPQLAIDGDRVVVAFNEFQGARVRLALMARDLAAPAWSGGYVDGVQLNADAELRLALDATGLAAIAYVSGSGVAGENAPRVVRQTATGWAPLCDGGVGADAGVTYANTQIGFGLQWAPDGSAMVVRTRGDFMGLQAWRCSGSGAWQTHGAGQGLVAAVDNSLTFLKGMAMATSGPPLVAVQVGLSYTVGSELHAYQLGPAGFVLVGLPYAVPLRGVQAALAVASAAPGSPVAAYGVETGGGNSEVHAARFHP